MVRVEKGASALRDLGGVGLVTDAVERLAIEGFGGAQAVAAGARITMPLADMFWGDRYAKLKDPFGHQWSLATHQRDLSPAEIQAGMAKMGT